MSVYDYSDALKSGRKAYRSAVSRGQYPYLPVLDEILKHVDIVKEVNLGVIQIPLDRVVGTSTASRTEAFARNFMPLLEEGSEFSAKWASLSDAQVNEGIRDPIKVYEYLNQFYVIEGNKRVSVMKFFGAAAISGEVIRKIPKKSDDLTNRIYYEFLDFYDITGQNILYESVPGTFRKILDATGGTEKWDDDKKREFSSVYYIFRSAFKKQGGEKLPINTGDALGAFLHIYGWDKAREYNETQMRVAIGKVWNEFEMLTQDEEVDLVMNPREEKSSSTKKILNYLLPFNHGKKYRAVFVYDKDPEESDWIYGHELGRLYLEDCFGEELETRTVVIRGPLDKADSVMEEMVSEGADIVFTVTPQLMEATLKCAVNHPEVKFLNCSLNTPHRYIRTYYGRMFEAKFLTGMIAGIMADNNKVGYLAEYPIFGAITNINAFALGARYVNPRARVLLQWSTVENSDPGEVFARENVRYLSGQDFATPDSPSREFGLYCRGKDGVTNMAMPVWHWGVFYERLIQSILSGSWDRDGKEGVKAYNYWWGMSSGAIDLILSNNVPEPTRELIDFVKQGIVKKQFFPFDCEVRNQEGTIMSPAGTRIVPEDLMSMDWLVDNVDGEIPRLPQLKEEARPVVKLSGVSSAKKEENE